MSASDIITIILAAYAAILSTILGLTELRKNRRSLTVSLEIGNFNTRANLRLVNSGTRPITVISVAMQIRGDFDNRNPPYWKWVPSTDLFERDPNGPDLLPVHLSDGEQAKFSLTKFTSEKLVKNQMKANVIIQDADGNEYDKYKVRYINRKIRVDRMKMK
jgi:hypothetical protein